MKHARLLLACLLVCLAVLLAVPLSGADKGPPKRTIRGEIWSPEDAPVNGAIVQLKNAKTLQIRSFVTKEDGGYVFPGLSTDVEYEVSAKFQDLVAGPRTVSQFDTRKEAIVNLKLAKK
jgi:hypothetical protein